ncbi:unnamed protein product, partial [Polarella glacialis]
ILAGEVGIYKRPSSAEAQLQRQKSCAEAGRRPSLAHFRAHTEEKSETEVEPEDVTLGELLYTMGPGKPVGMTNLMKASPNWSSGQCLEDCKIILITASDFDRVLKTHLSQGWEEKNNFLLHHLLGFQEFARNFNSGPGKTHASYMFAREKVRKGHMFLRQGDVADGALYVLCKGSVEFYRSGPSAYRSAGERLVVSLRHPVAAKQLPQDGFRVPGQRLSGGGGDRRECTMLPGGLFGSMHVSGIAGAAEPFTVVASQPCEVFACTGSNFPRLPYKILEAVRAYLAKVSALREGGFGAYLASIPAVGSAQVSSSRDLETPKYQWPPTAKEAPKRLRIVRSMPSLLEISLGQAAEGSLSPGKRSQQPIQGVSSLASGRSSSQAASA